MHQLQQQPVTSPTQSKTKLQVSPGKHVAVLALTGLKEPPSTCGVPLSAMPKFRPLSVLVRLQEGLHRGNPTPTGLLLRTRKTCHRCRVHQRGDFYGIDSPPTYSKCFAICPTVQCGICSHCSKSARESEARSTAQTQPLHFTPYTVLNLQEMTQPLQYTSAPISPHLHPHNLYGAFTSSAQLQGLHTPDTFCLLLPLYFSQASHH